MMFIQNLRIGTKLAVTSALSIEGAMDCGDASQIAHSRSHIEAALPHVMNMVRCLLTHPPAASPSVPRLREPVAEQEQGSGR